MRLRFRNSRAPSHSGRRPCAFTLVEVLMVIAISGILFVSLAVFTNSSIRMTGVLQDKNVAEHTARTALARFTREVSLANIIAAAEEYTITFTCTDITGDGTDDIVTYAWDSNTNALTRTLNGVTETFADNVDLFSIEYQYETEDEVTIASPGDTLPFVAGKFDGSVYDGSDYYLNIMSRWTAHYFTSEVELPSVNSITIRAARRLEDVTTSNMTVWLQTEAGSTLATGELKPSQLTSSWQDVTVPVEWVAGEGVGIQTDTIYAVCVMSSGHSSSYAGSIRVRNTDAPLPQGNGWWFAWRGSPITPRNDWAMYFTVSGDLPIATPSRSTVAVSILKKVKATIRVVEGDEETELTRTCKVVNQ